MLWTLTRARRVGAEGARASRELVFEVRGVARVRGKLAGEQLGRSVGRSRSEARRTCSTDQRPVQRPGEVLETVPGLVATQRSGNGKANQYFLRGFNLDHGTDFATTLDGIPVNLPTHWHGQGPRACQLR